MGFRSALRTETRGSAVVCSTFLEYREADKGAGTPLEHPRGRLIATEGGTATRFALHNIEPRGTLFISPGDEIYEGMIIGEHAKEGDLDVNAAKQKQVTNMRASGKDEALTLQPPRQVSLEEMICEMREDEVGLLGLSVCDGACCRSIHPTSHAAAAAAYTIHRDQTHHNHNYHHWQMLEVTPEKLRLRKRFLNAGERARLAKRGKKARMEMAA